VYEVSSRFTVSAGRLVVLLFFFPPRWLLSRLHFLGLEGEVAAFVSSSAHLSILVIQVTVETKGKVRLSKRPFTDVLLDDVS